MNLNALYQVSSTMMKLGIIKSMCGFLGSGKRFICEEQS